MRYNKIRKMDIADGPGVRVSIFMQGCAFNCPKCFNQETHDFPVYDRELLDNVFGDVANVEEWRECDEMPAPLAFSKKFSGTKNSSEYTLAKRQFNYLRNNNQIYSSMPGKVRTILSLFFYFSRKNCPAGHKQNKQPENTLTISGNVK